MAMSKIVGAPNLHGPWCSAGGGSADAWWIQGEMYTDNPGLLAYFAAAPPGAYIVTTATPTAAYLAAVAAMKADPFGLGMRPSVGPMPSTRSYPITP